MAAIDPTAEPEYDDVDDKKPPRSTLKIVRMPGHILDEDDSEDGDEDDEDDMLVE
jgi:FK506-binding nuclear protein